MSVEKDKILDMYKRGVISQEEATALLDALEEEKVTKINDEAKQKNEDTVRLIQSLPENPVICELIKAALSAGVDPAQLIMIINYLPDDKDKSKIILDAMIKGVTAAELIAILPSVSDNKEKFATAIKMLVDSKTKKDKFFGFQIDTEKIRKTAETGAKEATVFAKNFGSAFVSGINEVIRTFDNIDWNKVKEGVVEGIDKCKRIKAPENVTKFKIDNYDKVVLDLNTNRDISDELGDYLVEINESEDNSVYVEVAIDGVLPEETKVSEEGYAEINAAGDNAFVSNISVGGGNIRAAVDKKCRVFKIFIPADTNIDIEKKTGEGLILINVKTGETYVRTEGKNEVRFAYGTGRLNLFSGGCAKLKSEMCDGSVTMSIGGCSGTEIKSINSDYCDIKISGCSSLKSDKIFAENFEAKISGTAALKTEEFYVGKATIETSGASKFEYHKGNIEEAKLICNGASGINVDQCGSCEAIAGGASHIRIHKVTGNVNRSATGAASITVD